MTVRLLSIGTAVPRARLDQAELRDCFIAQPGIGRLAARMIGAAFDRSEIEHRYAAIGAIGEDPAFFGPDGTLLRSPSTGERNAAYRREAPALFEAAARHALEGSGFEGAELTHIVTASCTGCFSPGPDFLLARAIGAPASAERYHLGFMGCAAAFPALRAAARLASAQPDAVVLVACAELCSVHIRSSSDPEQIVASSVFGDGAAAAVVTSVPPRREGALLEIDGFTTSITEEGEGDMDWTIGDAGFEMRLTAQVPRIVGREIAGVVEGMLAASPGLGSIGDVSAWAVHPGGRSVLDSVQQGVGLSDAAMAHSRAVLREYGNMSSATVLFILHRLLQDDALTDEARAAGLAFGPGLTVETALFTLAHRTPEDRP